MFQQILLPTDGSEPAQKALVTAIDLARQFDATLHIINVVETVPYPEYPDMVSIREHEVERSEEIVEQAHEQAN